MQLVTVPVINTTEDSQPSDILADFYKALGWDSEKYMLDPRKVKIAEATYFSICDIMRGFCDDLSSINLLMLNYGPSVDNSINNNKVHLYKGWVTAD